MSAVSIPCSSCSNGSVTCTSYSLFADSIDKVLQLGEKNRQAMVKMASKKIAKSRKITIAIITPGWPVEMHLFQDMFSNFCCLLANIKQHIWRCRERVSQYW